MARKAQPLPNTDAVTGNSAAYLATSIEALAARLRVSIGKPDCWRVLHWVADEADRLSAEARDIGDEARTDEAVPNG